MSQMYLYQGDYAKDVLTTINLFTIHETQISSIFSFRYAWIHKSVKSFSIESNLKL